MPQMSDATTYLARQNLVPIMMSTPMINRFVRPTCRAACLVVVLAAGWPARSEPDLFAAAFTRSDAEFRTIKERASGAEEWLTKLDRDLGAIAAGREDGSDPAPSRRIADARARLQRHAVALGMFREYATR
jgi:hypothetical protein